MKQKVRITTNRFINTSTFKELVEWATPERAAEVLKDFADTPGPSQIAAWTKGPMVEKFINRWNLSNMSWESNFKGTGNGVFRVGNQEKSPVWIVAHWDVISFLIKEKTGDDYKLMPFHHHLMKDGSQPGHVLRFNLKEKSYEIICEGTIFGGIHPFFRPEKPLQLRSGDRVAYHTPVQELGDGLYKGQMDNAAGCAGALLAAAILSKIPGISSLVCFVDEEEGPVAMGNTAFARGSNRLLHHLPIPQLAIVVDHHTVSDKFENPHMGKGALVREYASQTRGGVTPPWLYETIRELAHKHRPYIKLNENSHADVSRSDCVSMMGATPNVVLCGPPTTGRHYAEGLYKCSSHDVAHLGRSLAMIALHFQT